MHVADQQLRADRAFPAVPVGLPQLGPAFESLGEKPGADSAGVVDFGVFIVGKAGTHAPAIEKPAAKPRLGPRIRTPLLDIKADPIGRAPCRERGCQYV